MSPGVEEHGGGEGGGIEKETKQGNVDGGKRGGG